MKLEAIASSVDNTSRSVQTITVMVRLITAKSISLLKFATALPEQRAIREIKGIPERLAQPPTTNGVEGERRERRGEGE